MKAAEQSAWLRGRLSQAELQWLPSEEKGQLALTPAEGQELRAAVQEPGRGAEVVQPAYWVEVEDLVGPQVLAQKAACRGRQVWCP